MSDDGVAALRATAHPLRLQMLSLLTGSSMSAADLARELGTTQANASYHLRVLAEAGEVVLDGEEKVRGGVAKRYRHPWDRADLHRRRSTDDPRHFLRAFASELSRRWAHRVGKGRTFLCDAEMWVSPEVWQQVVTHVQAASALLHDQAGPPRAEGTVHVNLQMVAFEMGEGP